MSGLVTSIGKKILGPQTPAANTRPACPGLWKTPVIRWDGELMVCCADVDGQIKVGNVRDRTLKDLWEGPELTQYRIWHILGEFHQMPVCGNCGGIAYYDVPPGEIHEYLREIGRPELFASYRQRLGLP